MDRRHFLFGSATACALALCGFPMASARAAQALPSRVRLFRLDQDTGRYLWHRAAPSVGAGEAPLRLRIDGMQAAAHGGVEELRVGALYAHGGEPWRFEAWHYRRGDVLGSSRASGFLLPRGGLLGLAFDWREGGSDWDSERLTLGPGAALVPGQYLLALAAVGGLAGLPYSGDPRCPLPGATNFDALVFVVEPLVLEAEEPQRADLACIRQATDDVDTV
ncbi:MAG TPA: hypothetical protein PKZ76_07150 [Xanthomonadaceae bacterium]|nr:hypothetical protein [Xanthomonadaceae bacterium]